ncbi:MAG TPA: ribonuclease III [Alphaproteobacteria bacterium]|nr:ribonuclease III [Alphaproteobacteria bacterium]
MSAGANDSLASLSEALGHRFAAPSLLRFAVTHSSASGRGVTANERLEFLGDRVLGLVIADLLYRHFASEDEGHLARRFAVLVSRESLAQVAGRIGLARFLTLARGEEESGGRTNPAILADACEAVIAALYLDGGLEAARRFIEGEWGKLMQQDERPPQDPKTALQEWAQAAGRKLPSYIVVGSEGPAHEPLFTVEVRVEGLPPALGTGRSKRAAEQAAAAESLRRALGENHV